MADIHSIIRNIRSRNSLEENLSAYLQAASSDAARASFSDLSLHYLSLYESVCAEPIQPAFLERINAGVAAYLDGTLSVSQAVSLRRDNMQLMQNVSAAADSFALLEYLMNRTEHRFEGEREIPADYSDLAFTEEIMAAAAQRKDEARGLLVSDILGELPVRMTRERFFETILNRLSIYLSSDAEAFYNMLSVLNSAAGLSDQEPDYAPYRRCSELLEVFREKKTADIEEEEYFRIREEMTALSGELDRDSEFCRAAAAVLNNLEILTISGAPDRDAPEYESAERILRNTLRLMQSLPEEDQPLLQETMECCRGLEGHLEEALDAYRESISFYGDLWNRFGGEIRGAGLSVAFSGLLMIRDLRSDSLFARERVDIPPVRDLGKEEYMQESADFLSKLSGMLKDRPASYVRAVMGRLFAVLPPVFKSSEELENYIFASLSSCRSVPEKLCCIELIGKFMEQS